MEPINDPEAPEPDDFIKQAGLSKYRKTIVALVGATVSFVAAVVMDDQAGIQAEEWVMALTVYGTALGVYQIPNAVARLRR